MGKDLSTTVRSLFPLDRGDLWKNFTIGFDDFFGPMESLFNSQMRNNFPSYNITKENGNYIISLGVSGYTEEDLTVESDDEYLIIRGNVETEDIDDDAQTIHRGLSSKKFKRVFRLEKGVEVKNVTLRYGLLTIELTGPQPSQKDLIQHHINVK